MRPMCAMDKGEGKSDVKAHSRAARQHRSVHCASPERGRERTSLPPSFSGWEGKEVRIGALFLASVSHLHPSPFRWWCGGAQWQVIHNPHGPPSVALVLPTFSLSLPLSLRPISLSLRVRARVHGGDDTRAVLCVTPLRRTHTHA